ncbi:hypothetical protein C8Q80DRAFT_1105542 [Daedaleopsis nitida]|nr:hypothetical protein C8Q80DRAFT_1105542 [Daedaleopsis nitida]
MDPEHVAGIAHRTGCTHVHPGYGFLSESPKFASLFSHPATSTSSESITFVGPSVDILEIASDKMRSRELASSLGVPVAPGIRVASTSDVRQFVASRGTKALPIVLKALDGGGGRGIRLVNSEEEIEDAYKRCLGESPSKQIFAEKALVGAGWKHIEVQIVGDGRGGVTHLWERECSVQRRFQKVVEMAPSTLSRSAVQPLLDAATKMARHLKYAGLGTFEFLVNAHAQEWIFLEINPRIQVEHTVTEEIMDLDLVRIQLLLSMPGISLEDVLPRHERTPRPSQGHAIQLRLVAEDPDASFRLSPGTVKASDLSWPAGKGIRVDSWLSTGPRADSRVDYTVGVDFDSLLAKVIVRAGTIEEATAKAQRAMREFNLSGEVKTNVELLAGIVAHRHWKEGSVHTRWLEANTDDLLRTGREVLSARKVQPQTGASASSLTLPTDADSSSGTLLLQPGSSFQLSISPAHVPVSDARDSDASQTHNLVLSTIGHNAFPSQLSGTLTTSLSPSPLAFSLTQLSAMPTSSQVEFANPHDPTHLACPLAGRIVELHPALVGSPDAFIQTGEPLVIVSVMKMESVVTAAKSGRVKRIGRGIEVGTVISEGTLVCLENARDATRLREHIPPVTRFLCGSLLSVSLPMMAQLVSPYKLLFVKQLVTEKYELWRVFTSFFIGGSGINFIFDVAMF